MLKNRLKSLNNKLSKAQASKDQKFYVAFVSEQLDKAVVEHNIELVFEGSYTEYKQWLNKRNNGDFYIEMDWGLKGPIVAEEWGK